MIDSESNTLTIWTLTINLIFNFFQSIFWRKRRWERNKISTGKNRTVFNPAHKSRIFNQIFNSYVKKKRQILWYPIEILFMCNFKDFMLFESFHWFSLLSSFYWASKRRALFCLQFSGRAGRHGGPLNHVATLKNKAEESSIFWMPCA